MRAGAIERFVLNNYPLLFVGNARHEEGVDP